MDTYSTYTLPTHTTHTLTHCIDFTCSLIHAHSYCIIHTLALIVIVHPSLSPLHSCAPFNVSLSNNDRAKSMTPSCTYRGSPQPQLRRLRNNINVPLVENGNSSITVHLSQSSFDSLLTVPLMTGKVKVQYTFSFAYRSQSNKHCHLRI